MRSLPLLALAPLLFALIGCPPAKEDKPLPPSGLAGSPGAAGGAGGAGGAGLALPGAGAAVAPSGDSLKLPAGHPPIDDAAQATAGAAGAAGKGSEHPAGSGSEHPAGKDSEHPSAGNELKVTGKVLEVLEVPQYTYMRLNTPGGEVWAAVGKAPVKVGDEVTISQPMVMENFPSRALNRTFPKLLMGNLVPPAAAKKG